MFIQYGAYQHQIREATIVVSQQPEFRSGIEVGLRVRYDVAGRIQIDDQGDPLANQSAMTAALLSLEAAYAVNGFDFGLYQDDGSPTRHVLLSGATLGGNRVVMSPSYPRGNGAEYSTFRNYTLAIEGLIPNLFAGLIEWHETLEFSGGGPQLVWLEFLTGDPQPQLVKEQTTFKARQTGSSLGNLGFVPAPDPLWPASLHEDRTNIRLSNPERIGLTGIVYRNYRTEWSYEFEDAAPLDGLPNFWGN
jgi:hypothetical protein